LTSGHSDA